MKINRLFLVLFLLCGLQVSFAVEVPDDSLVVITGMVKENVHKKILAGTNLSVPGSNIATVTNSDGFFSIKIPKDMLEGGLKAEHIGYKSVIMAADKSKGNLVIWMTPSAMMLDEVTIVGAQPRGLIEQAISKIPQNYPSSPCMLSSFYRETIQKGRRYIGVSEAIVNVFKRPYKTRYIGGDKAQVIKGRRLVSQHSSDTIAVKIVGGPTLPVILDVVKNEDALFKLSELDYYEFGMDPMVSIDGRDQFVVKFKPKVKIDYALNKGKVYIDKETHSLTRAEFSLDISDKDKATRAILYKKPRGLRFSPQEVDFIVTYRYENGVSYLNYIRSKTRFKCDWKRRLFSSGYTVLAEMVVVDRDDAPAHTIKRQDAFGQRDVFYDMVDDFNDDDFWKDYNIIEPTESLEKAVSRLRK